MRTLAALLLISGMAWGQGADTAKARQHGGAAGREPEQRIGTSGLHEFAACSTPVDCDCHPGRIEGSIEPEAGHLNQECA